MKVRNGIVALMRYQSKQVIYSFASRIINSNKYLNSYEKSKYVIQQAPYEYTSSYLAGSDKGPAAIVNASQFVELYDEE